MRNVSNIPLQHMGRGTIAPVGGAVGGANRGVERSAPSSPPSNASSYSSTILTTGQASRGMASSHLGHAMVPSHLGHLGSAGSRAPTTLGQALAPRGISREQQLDDWRSGKKNKRCVVVPPVEQATWQEEQEWRYGKKNKRCAPTPAVEEEKNQRCAVAPLVEDEIDIPLHLRMSGTPSRRPDTDLLASLDCLGSGGSARGTPFRTPLRGCDPNLSLSSIWSCQQTPTARVNQALNLLCAACRVRRTLSPVVLPFLDPSSHRFPPALQGASHPTAICCLKEIVGERVDLLAQRCVQGSSQV